MKRARISQSATNTLLASFSTTESTENTSQPDGRNQRDHSGHGHGHDHDHGRL
ncbi:MAG TPA: hypothetical protein VJ801_12215 [Polyangia bacterium]|nr:hypothetical protein [Polyangia bacterium]